MKKKLDKPWVSKVHLYMCEQAVNMFPSVVKLGFDTARNALCPHCGYFFRTPSSCFRLGGIQKVFISHFGFGEDDSSVFVLLSLVNQVAALSPHADASVHCDYLYVFPQI